MRHIYVWSLVALAGAIAAAGCGGSGGGPAAPHLVPGGFIGDGSINGLLNVYVTDDDTRAPVSAASVRVGASADPAACTGVTDSTGLVVFEKSSCAGLSGKQTVTASAVGYAPTTWIGANGANITMTIRATTRPAVPTAGVTGTIAGWDGLPAPAAQHNTLGVVGYSQTRQLGDLANNITQGTRTIAVGSLGATTSVPANVCVRNAVADDCNWQLTTRTGAQAHYAIIVDQDTNGTPNDSSDDTFTVIGWALATGLDFAAGQTAGGEALALVADGDMESFAVSIASPPAGLDALAAWPFLDLGDAGRIPMTTPALDLTHTMTRVPKVTGPLAGSHYDLVGQAQDATNKPEPATLAWIHGVDPSATVALGAWLPPPDGLSVAAGTYSFAAVAGATLQGAEIQTTDGARAWSITIFDGSTSFTLPGLTPNPLPSGTANLQVSALEIPGINLTNVSFDDARDLLTALSTNQISYTP
jgi:hypothetical protein